MTKWNVQHWLLYKEGNPPPPRGAWAAAAPVGMGPMELLHVAQVPKEHIQTNVRGRIQNCLHTLAHLRSLFILQFRCIFKDISKLMARSQPQQRMCILHIRDSLLFWKSWFEKIWMNLKSNTITTRIFIIRLLMKERIPLRSFKYNFYSSKFWNTFKCV